MSNRRQIFLLLALASALSACGAQDPEASRRNDYYDHEMRVAVSTGARR